VNVVSIRDIAGSSNATDLYGNTVITGSGQIPLHRNLSFSFEAGGSQTQWLSGDQDADYMLHAKLGYFKGVVQAAKDINLDVPLVVRLEGTKVDEGKAIINNSGLNVIAANDLDDAAQKIVNAVKG